MIKKLARREREYKKYAIATPLFMVGEVAMETLIPMIMAYLIDRGIEQGSMAQIWINGAILLVAAFLSMFFGVKGGEMAATASCGFARNLRHDMYYSIQDYSFSNIDKFSTSSIITRLTTDVANVQNAFQMIMRMAVRSPMTLIFSMVMALTIDAEISLVFLLCLPVLGLGMYLIMSRTHPIFRRVFKTYDSLNNVVQENLRGVRVVKNFVREDHEIQKFDKISESIYQDFTHAEKNMAFMSPLMMTCIYACTLLISWLGAKAIIASGNNAAVGMTTGQLMSMITYVIQILSSLIMLSMVFVMITMSRASAQRIVEVLDEKSDIVSPKDAAKAVRDGSVDFDHVSFRYASRSEKDCLSDIDLHIPSGAVVGVLGGTGAGKSTLMNILYGINTPTNGEVYVKGQRIARLRGDAGIQLCVGFRRARVAGIYVLTIHQPGPGSQRIGKIEGQRIAQRAAQGLSAGSLSRGQGCAVQHGLAVIRPDIGGKQVDKRLRRGLRALLPQTVYAVAVDHDGGGVAAYAKLRAQACRVHRHGEGEALACLVIGDGLRIVIGGQRQHGHVAGKLLPGFL